MRVFRWGNSLAIRLPVAVIEALDIKEGDDVEIRVKDERALPVVDEAERKMLLKRLRTYRGRLPIDFKWNRLDVVRQ